MATILVVEDHAMSRQVLKALFGYMGHRVLEAADGSAALALARSERPDLIISDVLMPTMDGVEFVRRLRAEAGLEKTPVIFYTATFRMTEAIRLGRECGVWRVIPKPSDPVFILKTVNEALGLSSAEEVALPSTDQLYRSLKKSEAFQSAGLQLATLMDLSFHLVSQRDPAQLMEGFSRAARDILKCQQTIVAIQQQGAEPQFYFGTGDCEPLGAGPADLLPLAEIMERVVKERSTLRRHQPASPDPPAASADRPFFQSLLAIPVASPNRVYGWICFADKLDRSPFTDEDEEMGVALSAQTALAYENILLIEELRHHANELEAKNKELEAFSYSVAHDLRAPLRHIDSFSRTLLINYAEKLDDRGREYLQRIRATMAHMAQLIDDLLKLAHLSRKDLLREPVDLSALARETAAKLKATDPGRTTEFVIMEGLAVLGDKQLLTVVLDNLLNNAWKFTEKTPGGQILFGRMQQDGKPVYFVRDSGVGFDMAYVRKLFRPFERLHLAEEFPGTGIGLATVQRIIQRHGGRVWIEGEVDKGATVYFTL